MSYPIYWKNPCVNSNLQTSIIKLFNKNQQITREQAQLILDYIKTWTDDYSLSDFDISRYEPNKESILECSFKLLDYGIDPF